LVYNILEGDYKNGKRVSNMKSVCIVTNFSQNFSAYSLCIVNERIMKMLVENEYKISVVVMESFKAEGIYEDPNVELIRIPQIKCHNEWKDESDIEIVEDSQAIYDVLSKHFNEKKIDCVISHDLFFQAATQKLDNACRRIAKDFLNIRWLHWVHSCATDGKKREKFPNSFVVYPNSYDIPRVARAFGYEEDEIKVVPHPIDICGFFDMHPLSEKIIKKYNILDADVIMTYPLRLDRGKQPEMCIKTMKQLKKLGKKTRLIFMDFHSTGGDKAKYREELKTMAIDGGLNSDEVIFVSEQDPSLKLEAPRKMVKDFMEISNVFIQPSRSETFSLVAQEAMVTGNFCILNFDFAPMRSIYGNNPLYRKFSSTIDITNGLDGNTETTYGNEDNYFKDIAGYICYVLETERTTAQRTIVRQTMNLKAVFKKYLEPLLYYSGR